MANVQYCVTMRVRPIEIWEALMKKRPCFMFQHASSTDMKQRAEAGSGAGYIDNIKVV